MGGAPWDAETLLAAGCCQSRFRWQGGGELFLEAYIKPAAFLSQSLQAALAERRESRSAAGVRNQSQNRCRQWYESAERSSRAS